MDNEARNREKTEEERPDDRERDPVPAVNAEGGGESPVAEEVDLLRRERDELKDKYLRARADAENQRKRLEREKKEYYEFALAELMKDLLAIVDNLELALSSPGGESEEGWREGIRRIHKQTLDLLSKRGVAPVPPAEGKRFDPAVHMALTTEERPDVKEPTVSEELQRGYRLHGRLLRPSVVKVAVPKKERESVS